MAISTKDKALVKAIMSKYRLTPEFTKSGVVKSVYMADLAANQATLNRVYQNATDAERKDLERFIDIHIRRNVDNIKREARRQRAAANKIADGGVKRSMLRRAKEIEETANDYKANAQLIQSGPKEGQKRTALGKIRAYKPAPKVEKLTQKQAVQNMIEHLALIGIISGITPSGQQVDTSGFTETDEEAPAEFTTEAPKKKKRPESEVTSGLNDLYTMDPSVKGEINGIINQLMQMYPQYMDSYFDTIEDIRDEKKRYREAVKKAKAEGTAIPDDPYPSNYGTTLEALLETMTTYADRLREDIQRGKKFGDTVPAEVLQALESAYSRIEHLLKMESDI